MRFLTRSELAPFFEGKTVAIVGSGPGILDNEPGFIDSHEVVVRINNYKVSEAAGFRTDVYYSFFGKSAKKTAAELKQGGVKLCMSKLPNAHPIESEWHRAHGMMRGVDFRIIYQERKDWWFCNTYIPETSVFLEKFHLLNERVPTTGFAAILDVLSFDPKSVYLTGFDFFRSGLHDVDRPWKMRHTDDPIGHAPEKELEWLIQNIRLFPITTDPALTRHIAAPRSDDELIFEYKGKLYPDYIKRGNACRFITPFAQQFCKGAGFDVGAGKWPLPGAHPIDITKGSSAMELPGGKFDYVFSSHCLEHLENPVKAIEHWKTRLKPGGVLFLYLPHPDMEYWLPQNNRKHLHFWRPEDVEKLLTDLGFVNVIRSERDLAWGFAVVGFA